MQKTYTRNFDLMRPGFLHGQGQASVRSLRNATLDKIQKFTITPAAGGAGAANYTIVPSVIGKPTDTTAVRLTYTAAHSLAVLLKDISTALNNDTDVFQDAYASSNSTSVVLNGRKPKENFATGLQILTSGTPATFTTSSTPASSSGSIGFGLMVAQDPTTPDNEAHLPTGVDSVFVGVTLSTYFQEKDAIGPNAKVAYYSSETMDVVDKTLTNDGIPVYCIESDITRADTVYMSYAPATAGYATKNAANAKLASGAKFKRSGLKTSDGYNIVMLSIDRS